MNPNSGKTRTEMHDARIEWLLSNQSMWEGQSARMLDANVRYMVIDAMRAAGLFSPKTNRQDIDLGTLIIKARRIRAARASEVK